ncbi:MAG: hypothetical protein GWN01_03485 [Nitrosopumilaceae archaeon]|nr:hypothetical protein [Nitrosopumilaceae archaeon]NIU00022.1 hypothetical protein [Nitrosopumilaceae archaeon]NIU86396.1 hypothetical protein [Nitrosopumilaceae archaeon]NIV66366.1 hypothetical protein [Nitrosopumilaceae archaeon]NIX60624.1 hypothetical protein [Nitrosopumilaceae archaeon]
MSDDLTKKAVDMLLKGATLLAEPCPYCKGVRVMKDGQALCVNCGKKPDPDQISKAESATEAKSDPLVTLEKKLEDLSKELEKETDYERQQSILKSINTIMDTIERLKKQ